MNDPVLKIYAKRNALLRSLALYIFALIIWVSFIAFTLHPKNIKIHPDLSPLIMAPLFTLFVIVIVGTLASLIKNVYRNILELLDAPKLVYRISADGFVDLRVDKEFLWHEFKSFRRSAKGDDIVASFVKGKALLVIEKRGLTSSDYKKYADQYIAICATEIYGKNPTALVF